MLTYISINGQVTRANRHTSTRGQKDCCTQNEKRQCHEFNKKQLHNRRITHSTKQQDPLLGYAIKLIQQSGSDKAKS